MTKPTCHAETQSGFLEPYTNHKYLSKRYCKKLRNRQIRQNYRNEARRELTDELLNSDFALWDDWCFYTTYEDD